MTHFSWLHLTDLHIGITEQRWLWQDMKDRFFEDLKRLHEKCGPWDLVLFTGDFTQRGTKEEFQEVDRILEELWTHLGKLGSNPKLLAVPGNHDLVRPENKTTPEMLLLRQWANQTDAQKEFWENKNSSYHRVIAEAFKNYSNWWDKQASKGANIRDGMLPGDFSVSIEKEGGAKLGIVGLNSSFLQLTDDDYKGKLALHARQFHEACGDGGGVQWVKQHHACLLMTHHPSVWLNSDSQRCLTAEITAHGRFAVHLCGHLHETAYSDISQDGTEPRRTWQGHSLFGLESFANEKKRLHGYVAGRIGLNEDDMGTLTFWPREIRLQGGQREIVPDFSINLSENGHTHPVHFRLHLPYRIGNTEFDVQELSTNTGEAKILHALYDYRNKNPGSKGMTLNALIKAASISRSEIFNEASPSLEEKSWIKCAYLAGGKSGILNITSEGIRIVEDGLLDIGSQQPQSLNNVQHYCPATLDELAKKYPECSNLINRHELLNKIRKHLHNRKPVFLHGQTRAGKTELLKRLEDSLSDDYIPLMLIAQAFDKLDNFGDFLYELAEKLIVQFKTYIEKHLSASPQLVERLKVLESSLNPNGSEKEKDIFRLNVRYLPDACSISETVLLKVESGESSFNLFWDILLDIAKGKSTVMMWDEIEYLLDNYKSKKTELNYIIESHRLADEEHPGESWKDLEIARKKLDAIQKIISFVSKFMLNFEKGYFIFVGSERTDLPEHAAFKELAAKAESVTVPYYEKHIVSHIFDYIGQCCYLDGYNMSQRFIALSDGHPQILNGILDAISSQINNAPHQKKITEMDFNDILVKALKNIHYYMLWLVESRLRKNEYYVVWLISRDSLVFDEKDDIFEYSLNRLSELANEHLEKEQQVTLADLKEGVNHLEMREWITRKNEQDNLFRFKLGILPVWIRRLYDNDGNKKEPLWQ